MMIEQGQDCGLTLNLLSEVLVPQSQGFQLKGFLMSGFIKIHRKMLEWEWFDDAPTFRLFMYILLKSNYKDTRYKGENVPAGSCVCGISALATQTGLSPQQVRTALNKLISTGEITRKTSNKFSIISITNWSEYQGDNKHSNKQITNNQQTNNKQITPSKEGKKVRREEKKVYEQNFLDVWEVWPRKRRGNKDKAYSAYKAAMGRDDVLAINIGIQNYLDSDESKGDYAKGCAAWFNDDRWTNNYTTKGNTNGRQQSGDYYEQLKDWVEN